MSSFNTSNIQSDTLTAVYNVTAPKHTVGTVELTQDGNNLSVIGVNSEIVNTDDVVASVSVSTPLLTSPSLFPMTVQNLQKVQLSSGSGSTGQVLALDASSNLIWADNYSSPQGLASVLNVSNDASGNSITNLLKLTPVSGSGTSGQVLSCDVSGNLDWVDLPKTTTPNLDTVLTAGNSANNQAITNVSTLDSKALRVVNANSSNMYYELNYNESDESLLISTSSALGADGSIKITNPDLIFSSSSAISALTLRQTQKTSPYDIFVSTGGNNGLASGYQNSPNITFRTIQGAINYCEALTAVDNIYRYIHVLAGEYTENITISKKVYIQGEAQTALSASVGCCLTGSITVNINSNGNDMFNNQVTISGILINGWVNNVSNVNHMLCLENCYIYSPNDTSGRGLYNNTSSSDCRLKLWNCQIISGGSNGTDPLMEIVSRSQVSMNYCSLSAKGNQSVLIFSGTSNCDSVNNCKFENSNSAGLTAQPVVKITSNISATFTFTNCAFIYSNSSDKTANPNASGILNQNLSGNNTIICLYNTFLLAGTNTSNNYSIQDFNHATPTQMICLYYMSGATPANAFAIHGNNNQNKFQLQIVS